ncbi:MAG: ArsR/SmtB family transcription factor [Burkholderiales bacterium]
MANERRLEILGWLREPRAHFREQQWGDLVSDGVCGQFIAEKLEVSQPTASEHLRLLVQADLLIPKRIKQWIFYRRNEEWIAQLKRTIATEL